MQTQLQKIREGQQGFTLVELAVVMIIIGLLIGGVLKGQELITNARITSTIGQFEGIAAAYNDFRNQFNGIPGDMATATTRLPNCAAPCGNGDGNGILENGVGVAPAIDEEGTYFFTQLLAANYITGMDGSATLGIGTTHPAAALGGVFMAGDSRTAMTNFPAGRPGAYLFHNGSLADVADASGLITGQQAANIDRRLDDGMPTTGSILGDNDGDCPSDPGGGAPIVYNQAAQDSTCGLAYRL